MKPKLTEIVNNNCKSWEDHWCRAWSSRLKVKDLKNIVTREIQCNVSNKESHRSLPF